MAALLTAAAPALADPGPPTPSALLPPSSAFVIDLGAGVGVGPAYPGSDEFSIYPFPIISFVVFTVPGLGTLRDEDPTRGLILYPTFNYIGERSADDHDELTGTDTIDASFAAGLGIGWRGDGWRVFGEADYGFGGYSGFTGRLGVDAIIEPVPRMALALGPRLNWSADDFVSTYFGVTAAEAAASGGRLEAFDPSGGIVSAGLAASATYAFTDTIFGYAEASWDAALDDVADSPITEQGSENAFVFRVGLSYRFDFGGKVEAAPAMSEPPVK